MAHPAPTSKFTPARVTVGGDSSADKTIVTGDSGVGKTYFLSTIVSDDGRAIFILPVEEGLKGASPYHTPAKFSDAQGNPIMPESFAELLQALVVFRDQHNVSRPAAGWIEAQPFPEGSAEREVLRVLVDLFPHAAPIPVIATRADLAPSAVAAAMEHLVRGEKARVGQKESFLARPDRAWKRPHLHFGLDSLSGVEALIHREVTGRAGVESMAAKEYNKLYVDALPLWQQVRDQLDLIRRTGVHVWLIAHCIEDIEASQTTGEIYRARDLLFRGSGKVLADLRAFWRQWANNVYYIQKEVDVRKGDKTRRTMAAFKGRVLLTQETATCKAKTRLALPAKIPATWTDLKEAMKFGGPAPVERLRTKVQALVPRLPIENQGPIAAELVSLEKARAARPREDKQADGLLIAQLSALLSRVEGIILCAEDARAELAAGDDDAEDDGGGAAEGAPASGRAASEPPPSPPAEAGEASDAETGM